MTGVKIYIKKEDNKMSVNEQLEKEIGTLFEALEDLEAGTEEYDKVSTSLNKLLDKYNEMTKTDYDYWDRQENRTKEYEFKEKQLEEDRKDRRVKNGLTATSIVTGLGLTVWGTLKSLKFEETGTVTTNAGREFIKKLFHMK